MILKYADMPWPITTVFPGFSQSISSLINVAGYFVNDTRALKTLLHTRLFFPGCPEYFFTYKRGRIFRYCHYRAVKTLLSTRVTPPIQFSVSSGGAGQFQSEYTLESHGKVVLLSGVIINGKVSIP